ncbi:TerD domain-containing protein [Hypoxylon argillaceum]|nr:TerD domain-containing protein [Hypoxylon argillaceum]KAI1155871.1 TerD domain-containing protein [Nemania diffusa]
MSHILKNGEAINLSKDLTNLTVGVGWDPIEQAPSTEPLDLDVYAILMADNDSEKNEMVNYAAKQSKCGSIRLSKDNITGEGDGDDEQLWFTLNTVAENIKEVDVWIVIYKAKSLGQSFSNVKGAHCRLFQGIDGKEEENGHLASFDISVGDSNVQSIHAATLFRQGESWSFRCVEKGYELDHEGVPELYNLPSAEKVTE